MGSDMILYLNYNCVLVKSEAFNKIYLKTLTGWIKPVNNDMDDIILNGSCVLKERSRFFLPN